jgi:3-dehydroquinate synthetase
METNHTGIHHLSGPGEAYPILLGEELLPNIGEHLKRNGLSGPCALVTNPTVGAHYAEEVIQSLSRAGFRPTLCEIPDGEQYKRLETVTSLYGQFLAAGLERKSPVLA